MSPVALDTASMLSKREDGLYLPVFSLSRAGTNVRVAGVMHIADRDYWDRWEAEFVQLLDDDRQVQMELVLKAKDPRLPRQASRLQRVLAGWARLNGLQLQNQVLLPLLDRLTITDITLEDLIASLDRAAMLRIMSGLILMPIAAPLVALSRRSFVDLITASAGAIEDKAREAEAKAPEDRTASDRSALSLHNNVLVRRNAVAVEAIDAAPDGTLAVWGAAHLSGIMGDLVARGWAIESVEWRRAIALTK